MVDITPESIAKAEADLKKKTEEATEATKKQNEVNSTATSIYDKLTDAIGSTLDQFSAMSTLTTEASTKLTLITSATLEAEKSFSGLHDTMASTFSGSFDRMIQQFGPAIKSFSGLSDVAKSLGLDISKVATGDMKTLTSMVMEAGQRLLENADYALKLQTSYLRLSAGTGELTGALDGAGDHLENMNDILMKQAEMLGQSIKATGASKQEVVGYYTALGEVPGALAATISTGTAADSSMSMLTATMKLATGTGQTFTEVTSKLSEAFDKYGVTGQAALEFTASISELSQKYGIKLKDVESTLMSVGVTLSKFNSSVEGGAAITKNAAEILNQYEASLKATGLSGKAAADVISGMTQALGGMTLAQQSFLSSQTGGPGGLMGGYQIEKMMRDGDIKGVMDKVRQQMTSQMGPIVSLEEASKDQGAASQRTRQMQILMDGPLGKMTGGDREKAEHLLDALKTGTSGTEALGGKDFMAKAIDKGTDIQAQSYTQLTRISANTDALQLLKGVDALKVVQGIAGTASEIHMPATEPISTAEQARASGLAGSMKSAADLNRGPGSAEYKELKDIQRLAADLPDSLHTSFEKIKGIFGSTGISEENKTKAEREEIVAREASIKKERAAALSRGDTGAVTRIDKASEEYHKSISGLEHGRHTTAGARVGAAAHAGTYKEDDKTTSEHKGKSAKDEHEVHLKVTAICSHCKRDLETHRSGSTPSTGTNLG